MSPRRVVSRSLRVLLVEDSLALREAFRGFFRGLPAVRELQEVEKAAEALELLAAAPPDILILDLTLREGNGLEVLARVRALGLSCRVLVFTSHDADSVRERCLAAGADRFFSKSRQHRELLQELREICG